MEQGITVFDRDFRLICWNRQYRALFDLPERWARSASRSTASSPSSPSAAIFRPESGWTMLNRAHQFRQPLQIELRPRPHHRVRSNPMPDGGMVATYADISSASSGPGAEARQRNAGAARRRRAPAELTRVNEELAQAQMLAEEANLGKTRFLAAAGHDILQPLNAARLYCSSLIEKAGGAGGKAAVNIESSLESVETILGAVLDISRLDTGAMKPDG